MNQSPILNSRRQRPARRRPAAPAPSGRARLQAQIEDSRDLVRFTHMLTGNLSVEATPAASGAFMLHVSMFHCADCLSFQELLAQRAEVVANVSLNLLDKLFKGA